MSATFGPSIKAVLKENDCTFVRYGKGDHEIWYSPITERHITVDDGCKSRHTANAIMKQAGIKHRF
jgi:hypothetical protein